jgi:hypothetical protein
MAIAFASFPTSTLAEVSATQIKLTAKQIEGFITAQDDITTAPSHWMTARHHLAQSWAGPTWWCLQRR